MQKLRSTNKPVIWSRSALQLQSTTSIMPPSITLVLNQRLFVKSAYEKYYSKDMLITESVDVDYHCTRLANHMDSLAVPQMCSVFLLIAADHIC